MTKVYYAMLEGNTILYSIWNGTYVTDMDSMQFPDTLVKKKLEEVHEKIHQYLCYGHRTISC